MKLYELGFVILGIAVGFAVFYYLKANDQKTDQAPEWAQEALDAK